MIHFAYKKIPKLVVRKKKVMIYVQLFGTTSMTTLIFSNLIGQK